MPSRERGGAPPKVPPEAKIPGGTLPPCSPPFGGGAPKFWRIEKSPRFTKMLPPTVPPCSPPFGGEHPNFSRRAQILGSKMALFLKRFPLSNVQIAKNFSLRRAQNAPTQICFQSPLLPPSGFLAPPRLGGSTQKILKYHEIMLPPAPPLSDHVLPP